MQFDQAAHIDALQEAFFSECVGKNLYSQLQRGLHGKDASHRHVLELLEAVEDQTRAELASLMAQYHAVPDHRNAEAVAIKLAQSFEDRAWPDMHAYLLNGSRAGRGVYERVRASAQDAADRRIDAILKHIDVVEAVYDGEAKGEPRHDEALAYLARRA